MVGKLRTHEDKHVADLAKETVKKWKNDVAAQKEKPVVAASASANAGGNVKQSAGTAAAAVGASKVTSPTGPGKGVSSASSSSTTTTTTQAGTNGMGTTTPSSLGNGAGTGKTRDAASDGIAEYLTEGIVRNGSITLLYNAIVLESTERTLPPPPPIPRFNLIMHIKSNIQQQPQSSQ